MTLSEIKNKSLKDLITQWQNDFKGVVDLYEYDTEADIINAFLEAISYGTFNGDYIREEIGIRQAYYNKFLALKQAIEEA